MKNPFDEELARNFFQNADKLWITPEINRRRFLGTIDDNFKWSRCRVLFPKVGPLVVEFNDEISWQALVKKAPGTSFEFNDPIFLYHLQKVIAVRWPKINEKPVGFAYIEFFEDDMEISFDFSPNHPDFNQEDENLGYSGVNIVNSMQRKLELKTIGYYKQLSKSLRENGLWAIPSLIPYPLNKITKQIEDHDIEGAKKTFIEFGTIEFIKKTVKKWEKLEPFARRKKVFEEAIFCHENKKFHSGIHTLSPHIEGIITDFLNAQFKEVPHSTRDRIKKFLDFAFLEKSPPFVFQNLAQSLKEFLLVGPALKSFEWLETIENIFPNRHIVGHGKYDESLYNEENSLKMFLLLESIHYVMANMPENWVKQ